MKKEIYLAGGCFWGAEKYLSLIPGVLETEVGYANGKTTNPTYEDVCCMGTEHAETVKVVYEDEELMLKDLLSLFYEVIDPTSLNRQGNDRGIQYRTGIYFVDEKDKPLIRESLDELQKGYEEEIVIELLLLENYYPAEEYHQKYLNKNPMGYCHIGKGAFKRASEFKPK